MSLFVLALNEYGYRVLSRNSRLRFGIVIVAAIVCLACLLSIAATSPFSATALRALVLLTVLTPLIHFVASRSMKQAQ